MTKGKQVYLAGSMTYEEWTDKDGVKKTKAQVKLSGPRAQLVLLGGGDKKGKPAPDSHDDGEETPF